MPRRPTPSRVDLTDEQRRFASDENGVALGIAMRVVTQAAELLGARRLIPIASAHIDSCLYHGDSGVEFAERLAEGGGRVAVPATLNVGALDLLRPDRIRLDDHRRDMARRQMDAYVRMGCRPTWTCAPYQAGHRPGVGEHVAWGESNAIAFANSVLGARTDRYGDFLDTCCALAGVAPESGLHLDARRRATVIVQLERVSEGLRQRDVFFPVLGHWLGHEVGQEVAVLSGLDRPTEDQLKALGAAAASSGSVGLFHVAGVTPEAPTLEAILDETRPTRTVAVTPDMIRRARDELSTTRASGLDAVALGSPHFSVDECERLMELVHGEQLSVPVYVCTGRHTQEALRARGWDEALAAAGVQIVVDTCVVVTPVLRGDAGVLMTNSGKFAHYARPNTGFEAVYGSLEDCITSAIEGRVVRDESVWQ